MSGSNEIDIGILHTTVLREVENDSLQELKPNFYQSVSEFLGDLKKQEFDGVQDKIKDSMISMTTELVSLLINARIHKVSRLKNHEVGNLLDEEKFIFDAYEQQHERTELILSATIHGRSKFLESVSQKHKTRLVPVRFLQGIDEIVGADLERYGPFKVEDIATIPYENAQALIAKNAAAKVSWED